MGTLLETRELSRRFGSVVALDSVSLQVEEHTITALIGPNGSGKTTLFNVVTGYLPPTQGGVSFKGTDITGLDPGRLYRRGLSRTFQQARVFPDLTVQENVAVAAGLSLRSLVGPRMSGSDRRTSDTLLTEFGLDHVKELYARELSYGQRKLLEFAAILASDPAMILLDEPTAGVNPSMIATMERHIRRRHQQGVTFLIVEHDMEFVMGICNPVIVMDHGRPIFSGTPDSVQSSPVVLDAYLGS